MELSESELGKNEASRENAAHRTNVRSQSLVAGKFDIALACFPNTRCSV
jgi:hypothetical protein